MNVRPERHIKQPSSRTGTAIDNLRAVIVVLVVAVHSMLAYLTSIGPGPLAFDKPPFMWRTFPVVDPHRFIGFDIFCAWCDAFLMALFFLVSGFFVWPSLERGGTLRFVRGRALRLGTPFMVGILLLMPIANYPAYLQTAADPSIANYWRALIALPFWPAGPMWFLWFLLAFDLAVAAFFKLMPQQHRAVRRLSSYAHDHPLHFLSGLLLISLVAYFPFGFPFNPMSWFHFGPFSFQLSFPGLYAAYFCAGIVIGARGIENRLVAPDGPLARYWRPWAWAAALTFAIWLLASANSYINPQAASPAWKIAEAIALPPACFTSCCAVLGATIRFAHVPVPWLDSLQRNAFGIYLLHCGIVVWTQFALLEFGWPALLKASFVFVVTLALSWAAAAGLRRVPIAALLIGIAPTKVARPVPIPTVQTNSKQFGRRPRSPPASAPEGAGVSLRLKADDDGVARS